jgi:rhodanese-related sulfurtransferase
MNHNPAFLELVAQQRKHVTESTIEGLISRSKQPSSFVLIDVREESEFINGHIPGAVWLGKGIIERDIESLYPDKNTEVWLYCGGGFRSILAADNLQKMGYTKVVSVDGGFKAWANSGAEVMKPSQHD